MLGKHVQLHPRIYPRQIIAKMAFWSSNTVARVHFIDDLCNCNILYKTPCETYWRYHVLHLLKSAHYWLNYLWNNKVDFETRCVIQQNCCHVLLSKAFADDLYSSHVFIYMLTVVRSQIVENYINKPVFSFLRQLKTWHCLHLLLSAVLRRRCCWAPTVLQSIDVSCPPGAQQQTTSSGVLRANNGTDGQTDGRTPDRYIDPAAHTMRAASITECVVKIHTKNKQPLLLDNVILFKKCQHVVTNYTYN